MPYFIKLNAFERKGLFKKLKNKTGITWESLYSQLNVSRAMFYHYISGKYDLPEEIFFKLKKIAETDIEGYERIFKEKYIEKKVKTPEMGEDLAEIFGILNGDGHVSEDSEICVVISSLEKEYFRHMKKLFEKTFGLEFKRYQQTTRLKLRTYSKNLAKILNKNFGLPRGNKLKKLKIPRIVFNKKEWLRAYIRGLFDTDGSVYIRRKKDIVVEIISANPEYLKEIKNALNSLGFICGISGKNLYIYRKRMVSKFFKEIKPSNSKHLKKFESYSNSCAGGPMV